MLTLDEQLTETSSCVYKLYHGSKYIIVKAKNLSSSIYLIDKGYAGFLVGGRLNMKGLGHKEWEGKSSFYFKFYSYKKKFPRLPERVEVLLESDDAYELLQCEQEELHRSIRDKKCLNSNVESYIPKYRSTTNTYGWISAEDVSKFKKLLLQPSPVDVNNR